MFQMSETDREVEIRMSATLEAIEQADERLSSWLSWKRVPVNLFATRMLLREALLNAVTHGSGTDAGRTVFLKLELGEDDIRLDVEDAGQGFAWNRPPPVNDLAGSGRGLAVMREYADAMDFNQRGNRITLRKRYENEESGHRCPNR